MTTAFMFPVENYILLWNTCKSTLCITEPFFTHKNAPSQSLAGMNEKVQKLPAKITRNKIHSGYNFCWLPSQTSWWTNIKKNIYTDALQVTNNSLLLVICNAWDFKLNQQVCCISTKSKTREKNVCPTYWEKVQCLMKETCCEKAWLQVENQLRLLQLNQIPQVF